MGRRLASLIILPALTLIAATWLVFERSGGELIQQLEERAQTAPTHQSYFMSREFFDRAYSEPEIGSVKEPVLGGIIPHHLLASRFIANFFRGLENTAPPVVVVIGPNHYNVGNGPVLTSELSWDTPYGVLHPELAVIQSLVQSGLVNVDERVFGREHSISSEVSFIRKSFPNARFVPLVLKNGLPFARTQALAQELSESLPAGSLVIGSVDFAHYVTSEEADRQDSVTRIVLESLDSQRLSQAFADSRPTLVTIFEYLKLRGSTRTHIIENSNSAKLTGDRTLSEVTSYFTVYFTTVGT